MSLLPRVTILLFGGTELKVVIQSTTFSNSVEITVFGRPKLKLNLKFKIAKASRTTALSDFLKVFKTIWR